MIRTCPQCGQKNRVQFQHLTHRMRCAKCKTVLPPIAEPIDADRELFDGVLQHSRFPVLVDFWAEWCGPCHMAAPEVKQLASEMAGRAIVLKVDTERHPETAARYGVRGIPNFVVFRNGQVVFQQAGVVPATEMKRWLEDAERKAS